MSQYRRHARSVSSTKGRFSLETMQALSRLNKRQGGNHGKKKAKKIMAQRASLRKSLYRE